ncbi:MAG: carboxy terminal-processing peptidase [Bdellovibrionaceae bacterium]|nr:carboxy terminal-processing peptidase [Pseudobdellovibrionaceae bacterium]
MALRSKLLLASLILGSLPAFAQKELELQCRYITHIEQGFLSQHVKYAKRDQALQDRVVDQYVKQLDPTKVYLLKTDVDEIKKLMTKIFDKIEKKDCAPLKEAQTILAKRITERTDFAKKFLGKDYKFDPKTEFVFDPGKKAYPLNTAEAEEFLKKYIHFQVSNYLATDMKLDEAKTNVLKSWDRALKRITDTKEEDLFSGYLEAFAHGMDPHSDFMPRDNNEDFKISMSLSLQGIGATLSSTDGFTVVEDLVPGGPAARSGLIQNQDKIIAVGQEKGPMENVIEMDLRDVVKKIRGKKGTKVRLTILRKKGDGKDRQDITLVRDEIKLEDQAASLAVIDRDVNGVKKKIGVINFPSFYSDARRGGRSSAADVKKLVTEARAKKLDGLMMDLSTNGGGSLDDAVKIAGLFFGKGNVVKQSSRDDSRGEITLADTDATVDWPGPLVILTSRVSASASEIVAGTLKDYRRAVIVGSDHTFGKGTVQSVIEIPPSSGELGALKVTVGMFYTAGGNSTQHRGVSADVVIPGAFDSDEVGEKSLDYSLPPSTIPAFLTSDAYVKTGPDAWQEIKPDMIKQLADKSRQRVEKNDEFKKIVEELNKAKDNGKMIRLSEVMKDKGKKDKEKEKARTTRYNKEERDKEYLKRPDILEAVSVLMDLISLEGGGKVAQQNK